MIGYNDDELYVGLLDKSFQIIQYNMKNNSHKVIYENVNNVTICFVSLIEKNIYVGEANFKEIDIEFELKQINEKGIIHTIMKENVNKIPYINNNSDYIFVNYSNSYKNVNYTFLELVDIATLSHSNIDKRQCNIEDNGLRKGEMIVYCGGT